MIYIDSGAFAARWVDPDQWHAPAVECWKRLESERQPLATSNLVLAESITFLQRSAGKEFAVRRILSVYHSLLITIQRAQQSDELQALNLMREFRDPKITFTDCISVAIMRRLNIRRIFTFDDHFRQAGFEVIP